MWGEGIQSALRPGDEVARGGSKDPDEGGGL